MKSLEDGLSGFFFFQLEMCRSVLGVRDEMLWFGYEVYLNVHILKAWSPPSGGVNFYVMGT